jgi:septal ring factor EnvC (AmiA/AmiB activator)
LKHYFAPPTPAPTTDHQPPTTDQHPATGARAAACAMLAIFAVIALMAQTDERALTESQARRASERLTALQREADALASEQRTLLVDLRRLEVQRNLRTEELRQIEADAAQVSRQLGQAGNEIDVLEAETAAARPALEARMVELYKLGAAGYARLLLNVSDLKEFGRAYRMVAALAAMDRERIEHHQQNLTRLRGARQALEQRRAELAKLQRAAQAARVAAEQAATARMQLLNEIDRRRDLTAELAAELQTAQVKLQQTLSAINAGVPREAIDGSALPIRPFRGDLDWPVAGRVLTPFGRRGPNVAAAPAADGVQLAAPEGAPVRAVHDGTVAFAGPFTGYGNLVIVDHGAQVYSLYGQLGATQVDRGARVERGQVIGSSGRVLVGIPGIHFEMRVDGQAVNPLEWLKKRP